MSLAQLLLGIWLILVGITWTSWMSISPTFLGIFAFVTGTVWLLEGYHPVTIWRPTNHG